MQVNFKARGLLFSRVVIATARHTHITDKARSEEFVEHRQNGDADDHDGAELDGELLFHFMDVAFQFGFGGVKLMFQGEFQFLQRLFVGGLVLLKLMFQFGPEFLKCMFEGEFEVFFSNQMFIKVGLPIGEASAWSSDMPARVSRLT